VTKFCFFENVFSIPIICMDCGSCLSRNVSFVNADIERTPCVEWRHVSGGRTI
jgi:hypothetical protein